MINDLVFNRFSYAGPGTQVAKPQWKQGWASFLASSRSWIVAHIDGRGSGGAGDRRRFEVYGRLGTSEVQDQLEVTQFLVNKLKFVDPRRIAIWGWSYGGYAALRAISEREQDLLQCAIAVAPVTSWRFYGMNDTVVINDPIGQSHTHTNSNYLPFYHVFLLLDLKVERKIEMTK